MEIMEVWKEEIEEEIRDSMHPVSYYHYTLLKKQLDAINSFLEQKEDLRIPPSSFEIIRELKDYDCGNI